MRGGMCLPLSALMAHMGKWLRRSNVMKNTPKAEKPVALKCLHVI